MCTIKDIEIDEKLIPQETNIKVVSDDAMKILKERVPEDNSPMGFNEFNLIIERENKRLEKVLLDDYYTNLQSTKWLKAP